MARSLTAERDTCHCLFVNRWTASLELSESLAPGEANLPVVASIAFDRGYAEILARGGILVLEDEEYRARMNELLDRILEFAGAVPTPQSEDAR